MTSQLISCEKEYAKDLKIKKDDILELLKWVHENPCMPDITEFMLIQCYHVSDYNLIQSQKLVQQLYGFKNKAPELFTGLDYESPEHELKFFDIHYMFVLPNIEFQGYRFIYTGFKNSDPIYFNTSVWISMMIKCLFTIILDQGHCRGYINITDSDGYQFGHVRRMNLLVLKKLLNFVNTALPIRMKSVHIIHAHRITDYLLTIIRPFLSKQLNESIGCYTNMEKLFEVVPKEYLPKDMGGSLPLTRDEYNEIQRQKVELLSDDVNEELKKKISKED